MPVVGFLAIAAVAVLLPDVRPVANAAPRPGEVIVANPADNPARATIVGPVTATIANTAAEAIPVAVQGTPSVTVTNAVTVANTVGVSGTVTVGNTAEEAIPVRVANAAPIPWVIGGQVIIEPGETHEAEQFAVPPPGYNLVIEAISINGSFPTGQVASEATLLATATGTSGTFRFHLPPLPKTHAAFDRFGTTMPIKVNVRSGAGVIVAVARGEDDTGTGIFNVALSGNLVPVN
jgi:hypothetical protein